MNLILPPDHGDSDIPAIADLCGQVEGANLLVHGTPAAREAQTLITEGVVDVLRNRAIIANPTAHMRARLATIVPVMATTYKLYREWIKAQYELEECAPYIIGNRFLDYGSGGGVFGDLLTELGFDMQTADVIDWRNKRTSDVPFTHLKHPDKIPFPDKHFDTTFVYFVLHHIDRKHLGRVLQELKRVSKRVIVKEDILGVQHDGHFNEGPRNNDNLLADMSALSLDDQFRFAALRDWMANVVKGGIDAMNLPFAFNTLEVWQRIFALNGFDVRHVQINGFEKTGHWKNSTCQGLFVLDAA